MSNGEPEDEPEGTSVELPAPEQTFDLTAGQLGGSVRRAARGQAGLGARLGVGARPGAVRPPGAGGGALAVRRPAARRGAPSRGGRPLAGRLRLGRAAADRRGECIRATHAAGRPAQLAPERAAQRRRPGLRARDPSHGPADDVRGRRLGRRLQDDRHRRDLGSTAVLARRPVARDRRDRDLPRPAADRLRGHRRGEHRRQRVDSRQRRLPLRRRGPQLDERQPGRAAGPGCRPEPGLRLRGRRRAPDAAAALLGGRPRRRLPHARRRRRLDPVRGGSALLRRRLLEERRGPSDPLPRPRRNGGRVRDSPRRSERGRPAGDLRRREPHDDRRTARRGRPGGRRRPAGARPPGACEARDQRQPPRHRLRPRRDRVRVRLRRLPHPPGAECADERRPGLDPPDAAHRLGNRAPGHLQPFDRGRPGQPEQRRHRDGRPLRLAQRQRQQRERSLAARDDLGAVPAGPLPPRRPPRGLLRAAARRCGGDAAGAVGRKRRRDLLEQGLEHGRRLPGPPQPAARRQPAAGRADVADAAAPGLRRQRRAGRRAADQLAQAQPRHQRGADVRPDPESARPGALRLRLPGQRRLRDLGRRDLALRARRRRGLRRLRPRRPVPLRRDLAGRDRRGRVHRAAARLLPGARRRHRPGRVAARAPRGLPGCGGLRRRHGLSPAQVGASPAHPCRPALRGAGDRGAVAAGAGRPRPRAALLRQRDGAAARGAPVGGSAAARARSPAEPDVGAQLPARAVRTHRRRAAEPAGRRQPADGHLQPRRRDSQPRRRDRRAGRRIHPRARPGPAADRERAAVLPADRADGRARHPRRRRRAADRPRRLGVGAAGCRGPAAARAAGRRLHGRPGSAGRRHARLSRQHARGLPPQPEPDGPRVDGAGERRRDPSHPVYAARVPGPRLGADGRAAGGDRGRLRRRSDRRREPRGLQVAVDHGHRRHGRHDHGHRHRTAQHAGGRRAVHLRHRTAERPARPLPQPERRQLRQLRPQSACAGGAASARRRRPHRSPVAATRLQRGPGRRQPALRHVRGAAAGPDGPRRRDPGPEPAPGALRRRRHTRPGHAALGPLRRERPRRRLGRRRGRHRLRLDQRRRQLDAGDRSALPASRPLRRGARRSTRATTTRSTSAWRAARTRSPATWASSGRRPTAARTGIRSGRRSSTPPACSSARTRSRSTRPRPTRSSPAPTSASSAAPTREPTGRRSTRGFRTCSSATSRSRRRHARCGPAPGAAASTSGTSATGRRRTSGSTCAPTASTTAASAPPRTAPTSSRRRRPAPDRPRRTSRSRASGRRASASTTSSTASSSTRTSCTRSRSRGPRTCSCRCTTAAPSRRARCGSWRSGPTRRTGPRLCRPTSGRGTAQPVRSRLR